LREYAPRTEGTEVPRDMAELGFDTVEVGLVVVVDWGISEVARRGSSVLSMSSRTTTVAVEVSRVRVIGPLAFRIEGGLDAARDVGREGGACGLLGPATG
jgi:hypothetical protein